MTRRKFTGIALAFLCALGCSEGKQVPAVGPGYEIIVLAPEESRELGKAVATVLSAEIQLVHFEPTFETYVDDLDQIAFYKTRKLLFAVAPPESEGLKKLLRRSTGTRTRTSFPGLWIETEPFAAGQVMFLFSGEEGAMREALATKGDELVEVVEEAAVTLIVTNLYRAGEQKGARRAMMARWGWGVRLPPEWVVDDRFGAENFVRVWRDAPVEQLFVSWETGRAERTPQEWVQRRHELVERFYEGDAVVFERARGSSSSTPFDTEGAALTGIWENLQYTIGGPFESWAFYCPKDDRTYLVDLSVYAPGRNKKPLMRTLEAVARTFRCGCVPKPVRGQPS